MTKIEWTEKSWNPIVGCSVVSPGCTNCYAMKMAGRIGKTPAGRHYGLLTAKSKAGPVWNGVVASAPDETWMQPLRRRQPTTWFVNSMGDLFHEAVPDDWIDRVFAIMALSPQHRFQVLTKRAERMREYFSSRGDVAKAVFYTHLQELAGAYHPDPDAVLCEMHRFPLPNVWLGVSAEDQTRADERIPLLLDTPAAVRFVSCEPLLGPVDLTRLDEHKDALAGYIPGNSTDFQPRRLDWAICGGESGPGARPMHPDWARGLRDQCQAAGVPFFFKQWGAWAPSHNLPIEVVGLREQACVLPDGRVREWQEGYPDARLTHPEMRPMTRVGKARAGRRLDGREWNELPGVPA